MLRARGPDHHVDYHVIGAAGVYRSGVGTGAMLEGYDGGGMWWWDVVAGFATGGGIRWRDMMAVAVAGYDGGGNYLAGISDEIFWWE